MENLNKSLEDLLTVLKEMNAQIDEIIKSAVEIQKIYAEEYMEKVADDQVHVSGHVQ